jgi:AcrR family transcriptional regulator
MTTKELILQASRCLFNQEGFEATSARQIARVVRISQGNLRYHYATKEAIAEQLFSAFYEEYRAVLQEVSGPEHAAGVAALLEVYRKLFALYDDYRFIMQDLWSLTRKLPRIKATLQADYQHRRSLLRNMLEDLVKKGHLERPEGDDLFNRIIYLQIFVGDCWMGHSGLYFKQDRQEEVRHYLEHWVMLLLPYLTTAGLEDLMQYAKDHSGLFFSEFNQLIQYHFDRKLDYEKITDPNA